MAGAEVRSNSYGVTECSPSCAAAGVVEGAVQDEGREEEDDEGAWVDLGEADGFVLVGDDDLL